MNWPRWNWLEYPRRDAKRYLLLPLLVAVLRTFWLWPWLELLRYGLAPSQPGPLLSLPLLVGLYLAGLATARWALAEKRPLAWGRLVGIVAGLVAVLVVLWVRFYQGQYDMWQVQWIGALGLELTHWGQEAPAPAIALLAGAYLWQQSLRDGRASLHRDEVWMAFVLGFLALGLAVIMGQRQAAGNELSGGSSALVLPYFVAGLAALALATVHLSHYHFVEGVSEARPRPNRYWVVSVVSVIAALVGVGLGLSALLTPEMVVQALSWGSVILDLLGIALYYILLVVSYLVFLVLTPLLSGVRWLLTGTAEPPEPIHLADLSWDKDQLPQNTLALPPGIGEALRWGGLVLALLGVGVVFALALRRWWHEPDEEVEESRELIFSPDLLQQQVLAWWRRWLRRAKHRAGIALNPFLSLDGETRPRREVRAIYQMFLAAAVKRGQPRRRGQTPLEYQHTLVATWAEGDQALGHLTEAYLQARYGPDPLELREVEQARQAWAELQTVLAAQDRGKEGSNEI